MLSLVTAATESPVSLTEAKLFLREDGSEQDARINAAISAATDYCEKRTTRKFCTQTWRLSLDEFPCNVIQLRLPPVQASTTSITYVDSDGTTQTWSSSEYQVDVYSEPARIVPAYGYSWPSTRDQLNAVNVQFTCGYGAATAVPQGIKESIKHLVAMNCGTETMDLDFIDSLLFPFCWGGYT